MNSEFMSVGFNEVIERLRLRERELIEQNAALIKAKQELEEVKNKLEHEQAFLQTILDHAPIGIWLLGTDNKIKFINQTFCNAIGVPEQRFKDVEHYSEVLPPTASENCIRSDRECMAQDTFHFSTEVLPFVDGKDHFLEITKAKIHDKTGEVIGLIGLAADASDRYLLTKQLQESQVQLRYLAQHISVRREEERKHIAREVHDELGSVLTGLRMNVAWMDITLCEENPKYAERVKDMSALLDKAGKSIRHIITNIRPIALDSGLASALKCLCDEVSERTGKNYYFESSDCFVDLDDKISVALFRIVQELLTNTVRHACAESVGVMLSRNGNSLMLAVKDDGKGFVLSDNANKKSFGLLGIQERVFSLGGQVSFDSVLGQGTTVSIEVNF